MKAAIGDRCKGVPRAQEPVCLQDVLRQVRRRGQGRGRRLRGWRGQEEEVLHRGQEEGHRQRWWRRRR